MGKSSLLIWCGNLILQKDLHHVYLILRNLLYLILLTLSHYTASDIFYKTKIFEKKDLETLFSDIEKALCVQVRAKCRCGLLSQIPVTELIQRIQLSGNVKAN
jgi:hypothetical protein